MTIELYAASDFPPDCNAYEATILRYALAYFCRRPDKTPKVLVHFDDWTPTVDTQAVTVFLTSVFADLIRLERIHPFQLKKRIHFKTTNHSLGRQYLALTRELIRETTLHLDRKAGKTVAKRRHVLNLHGKMKRKRIRNVHIPNAPRQLKRGEEPLDSQQWEEHMQRKHRLPDRQDVITEYYQHEYLPPPAPPLPRDESMKRAPTPATPLPMTKEADPNAPHIPGKRKHPRQS